MKQHVEFHVACPLQAAPPKYKKKEESNEDDLNFYVNVVLISC
jgi:hypothetical protein